MAQCMCKMMLDVADRDGMQVVVARQGDSATRFLKLHLFSCGEPMPVEDGLTVVLNAKNAAGEIRAFVGEVDADGTLTLPLNAWMLHRVGVVECDVSLFDSNGGKLTTPPFEVEVVASIAGDETLPGDDPSGESITARLIAEEKVFALDPTPTADGFCLHPRCNRKYALDLSGDAYGVGDAWCELSLVLPVPEDTESDNWILIYCHAPKREATPVSINWGDAESLLFADGKIPEIRTGDFDVVCTYSRTAGKWQIGTVQYESVGEGV